MRSYNATYDSSILAMFTIRDGADVREIVWVGGSGGVFTVHAENPDGTGTRQIGPRFLQADQAMSRALQHCGWGELALSIALRNDAEDLTH